MAYVPGYKHDVFVSYAHGDDREWIALLAARLEPALKQRLGTKPAIWIDDDQLRASRDFSAEIPDSVRSSAVFLLLTSPTYIRSTYCVDEECRTFADSLPARRARFALEEFATERFAFRCPILPTDNNEHWSLFPGLSDIPFCDEADTFVNGSPSFETSFRRLVGELVGLLKRMRNHSTSVFLYPPDPAEDIAQTHAALAGELSAHSYRLLPDRKVKLADQLREAELAVFLLGERYDEAAGELIEEVSMADKPWVAWCAPSAEQSADANQAGLCLHVEQLDSPRKTFLDPSVRPAKLKEEVLALLGPDPKGLPDTEGKPRVYLVYNARDKTDFKNAGLISYHFRKEVHFEHPDDPAQHTARLTGSEGVLLVWGHAGEEWCEREFKEMVQTSRPAGMRGLCLFEPADPKTEAVRAIRDGYRDLFVGEQFGNKFDPSRLMPFFTPLLRRGEDPAVSFAAAIAALRTLTNPYPGLRPFETSESHLFFGRDQQVAELVARLERNRFLAVVGVSGSGKSSLVRAGLIPALERGRVLEAGRRWRMVVTRPGGAPLQRLAADLERAGHDATPLTQSSHGLIEVARGLSSDESLLVLVDQFEELFRYKDLPATTEEARLRRGVSASEAAEFVQLLLEAARHSRPIYIVLTMRSDYLGDCAEFRDLPETLNDCQYLIPRMTRAQRKEAIEVPLGPVAMAPSLTQRLLNDAGDEPDQLPVLQHALMRTWARWRATDPEQTRRIELADYESIGGFQNAIDLHAEEVLAGVSDRGIAENIFKRLTATGRGNRERRDPATLDELCAVCGATSPEARVGVMAVIDAFRLGEATFLTPRDGDITGATYVDITHESLIRQWRRLRDVWLPGEQQSAKAFLTLAERARNWDAGKAEPLAGLDLADALEWNRRRNPTVAWAEHYGDAKDLELVLRFIAASKVHDRKLRLRKRGLWIALPLVFVFALLAGVAVWQAVRAASLREESRGGKLLARSQLLLTTDPNLTPSVLLAIEALSRLRSAEAEEALRHAVARVPRQLFQVPLAVAAARQDTPRDKERRDRIVTSIDGRSVAVVADDVHVSVLEAQTGRQIGTMEAPAPVFDIAPGSDGTWMIATAASDGSPSLISFPDGREIRRLTAAGGVTSMALSRDGRYAVTVGADAWRLHDLRDGRELGPPTPVNDGSTPVFSEDGNTIAMGGQDTPGSIYTSGRQEPAYRAFVFDTARQKPTIKYALAGKVQSLALTRDGRFLVAGDAGAARVWDLTDGSEPARMTTGTPLASVAISDDARVVVTAGADGTTRAFDTHGGSEIARVTIECPGADPDNSGTTRETPPCGARAVAMSPDGHRVFTAGDDAMLRAFEPLGASDEARITESLPVRGIAFARAGRRLVVGSAEDSFGPVRVFDADGWRESARPKPEKPELNGLAVSADGRFVVIASNWSTGPTLFDLDAPQKGPRELGGPSSPHPPSMALSGDGSSAAWISSDRAMRIDVAGGTPLALPDLIQTQAIALSDDGRTAAVGTGNNEVGEVVVLQIPAGTPTARVPFVGPPTFVAISPDGRWVAASRGIQGIGDNIIHVIDASAGQIRWKHAGAPNTPIAFTRDGRTVAMASADGTLRSFDTGSGRETFRIPLEEQPLRALAFDKQAVSLTAASVIRTLTGASGVTVKKYLLRRDDVVAHACSRLSRNLTEPEWTRYVGDDATYNATCAALPPGGAVTARYTGKARK